MRAIGVVLRKEFACEFRTKAGLATAMYFATVTVVSLAIASFGRTVSGGLAAGIIWVALLFAAVVALPRSFVSEEEQGTADLLRMLADPAAVFWGKAIFNLLVMAVTGLLLGCVYVQLAGIEVSDWAVFVMVLVGGCGALSGTVTICSALVSQAQNRGVLAGAIALPLLIPFVFLGVAALRFSLGEGSWSGSWPSILGIYLYALAGYSVGPVFFESVWKA